MRKFIDIVSTGLVTVTRYPARSVATLAALVAVLAPYLVGVALSNGVEAEGEASVKHGADLYVRASRFGRPAPVPLAAVRKIEAIPGVLRVMPRIVGEVSLGREQIRCVLVGLSP